MKKIITGLLLLIAISSMAQPSKINNGKMPFKPELKPFYHGVASGDPLSDRVIIWTRVTPEADSTIHVKYFVATDTSFKNIIKTGEILTDSTKDYTVKMDVTGLTAGSTYYYYFNAIGKNSVIGRTKTVPAGANENSQLKFAVVSCNNYEGGFFNAYGRIAERNDIDAVIHLGDYIYEYAPGQYRTASLKNRNGNLAPAYEIINKADYRLRYSVYRLDEDMMSAHQQHPFISVWDDHEFANDAYVTGAQNHTEGVEGVWTNRKALAKKVYFEWMPIRDNATQSVNRKIAYGNLMELFMLDTRIEARDMPPAHFDDADVPVRKMISKEQFDWLIDGMKASPAKWKVVGNQVIISKYNLGFAAGSTTNPPAPNPTDINKIRSVEDLFVDDWRGHPTQRAALIDSIKNKKINNVIFLTGDSHCSWAFDMVTTPTIYPNAGSLNMPLPSPSYDRVSGAGSVAVELGTPGISSQNFDEALPLNTALGFQYQMNNPFSLAQVGLAKTKIDTMAGNTGYVHYNPHLKYVDLVQQGYMMLDVKKDSSQADWYYVNILDSTSKAQTTGQIGPFKSPYKGAVVSNAANKLKMTTTISASKAKLDIPAPKKPMMITGLNEQESLTAIFSLYPNPATNFVLLNFGTAHSAVLEMEILDSSGKRVKRINKPSAIVAGNYAQEIDVSDLKAGIYFVKLTTNGKPVTRKLIVQ